MKKIGLRLYQLSKIIIFITVIYLLYTDIIELKDIELKEHLTLKEIFQKALSFCLIFYIFPVFEIYDDKVKRFYNEI
jgi:hypothetical protein